MVPTVKLRVPNLNPRQKIIIIILLTGVIIVAMVYNAWLNKIGPVMQDKILALINERVNGRVTVEKIDLSFDGTITLKQLALYDKKNNLIASAEKILLEFSPFDLLSGDVGIGMIRQITVEKPLLVLEKQNGVYNFEQIFVTTPDQSGTGSHFKGEVAIDQGVVCLETLSKYLLEDISGNLNFAKYPVFTLELAGRKSSIRLTADGEWSFNDVGSVTVRTTKALLTDMDLAWLKASDIDITAGMVNGLKIDVVKQGGKIRYQGEGTVADLAGRLGGYEVAQGTGKVKIKDDTVAIADASLRFNGQPVSFTGTLNSSDTKLDFDVTSNGFDLSVITGANFRGAMQLQAKVQGTLATPQASGQFTVPRGEFGSFAFTAGSGNFAYTNGTLTLNNTRMTMWDGTLFINGTVLPAGQRYNLTVTGSNIDSALLSDKEIRGRADFIATVSGQRTTGMTANGSFTMGEGSFYGIPFLSMKGDFSKDGERINFSNIIVTTLAGSFYATGTTEGSIIKLKKTGDVTDHIGSVKESIKENIRQSLSEQLRKMRP